MGQALNISCGCGYEKHLLIGEGLMAMNKDLIRFTFAQYDLSGFENALAGGMTDFSFGQNLAYCQKCADLVSATTLKYTVDGQTVFLAKPCDQCNGDLLLRDNFGQCPKCGKELHEQQAGLWD